MLRVNLFPGWLFPPLPGWREELSTESLVYIGVFAPRCSKEMRSPELPSAAQRHPDAKTTREEEFLLLQRSLVV